MANLWKTLPEFVPTPISCGTYASNPDIHFFLYELVSMSDDIPEIQLSIWTLAELHTKVSRLMANMGPKYQHTRAPFPSIRSGKIRGRRLSIIHLSNSCSPRRNTKASMRKCESFARVSLTRSYRTYSVRWRLAAGTLSHVLFTETSGLVTRRLISTRTCQSFMTELASVHTMKVSTMKAYL